MYTFSFFEQNCPLCRGMGNSCRFFGWQVVVDDFSDSSTNGLSTIFSSEWIRRFWLLPCMCLCVCVEEKVRKGDKKLWHSNVRDWSYCGVKKLESLKGRKKLFKTNSMSQKCLKYRAFVIARIGLFSWDLTGVCFRLNLFSPDNLCIKHWFKQSWFDTTVISSSLAVLTHFIYLSQTHI